MSEPTVKVRAAVYRRDGHQCVVCGRETFLEFQHRQAVGMGGSKHRPTVVEGLAACSGCNGAFEHVLQTRALLNGWKVQRWVPDAALVPVRYVLLGGWHLLTVSGGREWISGVAARALMVDVYGDAYAGWELAA